MSDHFYIWNRLLYRFLIAIENRYGPSWREEAMLRAGLSQLPPDTMDKYVEINHFSALNAALGELKPGAAREVGYYLTVRGLPDFLNDYWVHTASQELAFRILPLGAKLNLALPLIVQNVFPTTSDGIKAVQLIHGYYTYTPIWCPVCYGRQSDSYICHSMIGMMQGGLEWMTGVQLEVTQSQCHARGDEHCVFRINMPSKNEP